MEAPTAVRSSIAHNCSDGMFICKRTCHVSAPNPNVLNVTLNPVQKRLILSRILDVLSQSTSKAPRVASGTIPRNTTIDH